jgi:hypothetical protein
MLDENTSQIERGARENLTLAIEFNQNHDFQQAMVHVSLSLDYFASLLEAEPSVKRRADYQQAKKLKYELRLRGFVENAGKEGNGNLFGDLVDHTSDFQD